MTNTVVETKMRVKIGVSFQIAEERGVSKFHTKNNWKQFPGETKISRLTEFDGEWKIYIYIHRNIGKGKTDRCCGGGYLIIEFLEARLGWKELDFANATDVSSDGRIQFGRARRGIWYSWF